MDYEVGSAEWLEALDYPERDRAEIQRNRAMALKQGIAVDPQVAEDRKAALEAIEREFGEWTYFDTITVIAGGKKHTVPAGTVSESGPLRGGAAQSSALGVASTSEQALEGRGTSPRAPAPPSRTDCAAHRSFGRTAVDVADPTGAGVQMDPDQSSWSFKKRPNSSRYGA